MSAAPSSLPLVHRRKLQFSLRALLAIIFVCCVGLALWNLYIEPNRRRQRLIAEINQAGGTARVQSSTRVSRPGYRWDEDPIVEVGLEQASIDDRWLARLRGAPHLWELRLDHTATGNAGLAHLAGMQGLIRLSLANTRVTGTGLAHLRDLRFLVDLNLQNSPISDVGMAHVGRLSSLTTLDLRGTPVTDAGIARLAGLPRLSTLLLDNTDVTEASLANLKDLPALDMVSFSGTHITPSALSRELPAVRDPQLSRLLGYPSNLEFDNTPLVDVVEQLKDRYRAEIVLDRRRLEESRIDARTTVTFFLRQERLGSALSQMLRQLGLKCVHRHGVPLITTEAGARNFVPRLVLKPGERLSRKFSRSLHRPVVVELEDRPLTEALDSVFDQAGLSRRLDPKLPNDVRVSHSMRETPAATVLELLFDEHGLRGEIENNTIHVYRWAECPRLK